MRNPPISEHGNILHPNLSHEKNNQIPDGPTSAVDESGNKSGPEQLTVILPKPHDPFWKNLKTCDDEGVVRLATGFLHGSFQARALVRENNRTYQGCQIECYMLPCDEEEQDRLDFFHTVILATLRSGSLIHVPHCSQGRFLDLGCGTGIWIMEVAKVYPKATVLGVDISAIQPDIRPSNCNFRVPFNYELPWLIGEEQWDVIRLQMGHGSVTNWPLLYQRILSHLRSGCWFEQVEIDFEPRCRSGSLENTSLHLWFQCLSEATTKSKRDIRHCPKRTQEWLQEAGFSDICHEQIVLPLNLWKQGPCDRTTARRYSRAFFDSIEPLCLAPFSRILGWSDKEIQLLVAATKKDALDQNMHTFHTLNLYKARKPDGNPQ